MLSSDIFGQISLYLDYITYNRMLLINKEINNKLSEVYWINQRKNIRYISIKRITDDRGLLWGYKIIKEGVDGRKYIFNFDSKDSLYNFLVEKEIWVRSRECNIINNDFEIMNNNLNITDIYCTIISHMEEYIPKNTCFTVIKYFDLSKDKYKDYHNKYDPYNDYGIINCKKIFYLDRYVIEKFRLESKKYEKWYNIYGELNGTSNYFDDNDTLRFSQQYDNGVLISEEKFDEKGNKLKFNESYSDNYQIDRDSDSDE